MPGESVWVKTPAMMPGALKEYGSWLAKPGDLNYTIISCEINQKYWKSWHIGIKVL